MISEKDFLRYEKQTSKLYEKMELDLLRDIAQRIADVGELNTVGYNNAVILQQMGYLYEDMINDIAEHNEMNIEEVKKIFENAGITTIKKDDIVYKQAGISPGKISNTLYNIMERQADDTSYNILRLTRTIANTGQEQFINAINQAYLETSSGMKSYSQAIIDAVDKVGKQGAIVKYPSGVTRSVESAIRMNVLTAVGQMSGELQLERAQEVGWDLVEVSAHIGARPEHAEWQGKVYSLSGSNGYKDFYEETGYGTMLGLCGINCRHTFFPYYKGSTLTYTKNELEEMKNAKVHYNGQEMSYYDATQLQRRMERQIRQNRKDIAGLEGLKNSDVDAEQLQSELIKANNKLAQRQNILDDFIRQTEFKDNDRTYVGSITNVVKKEVTNQVVIKEFKPVNNIKEAENRITEVLDTKNIKLNNMNIQVANGYLEGIENFVQEYPDLKGFISNVNTKVTGRNLAEYDASAVYNVKSNKTRFNGTEMRIRNPKDVDKYLKTIDDGIKSNFQYEGCSPKTIAMHELTHAMEDLMFYTEIGAYNNGVLVAEIQGEQFNYGKIAKEIIEEARQELYGKQFGKEVYEGTKHLGTYARTNYREGLAQSISYEMGVKSSPYTAKVKEIFDRKIKEILK